MIALYPIGCTAQDRHDDLASGEAAARAAPQPGTRKDDAGSWSELGERVTTLLIFRESCWVYYATGGTGKNGCGQVAVWMHLRDRYKKKHRLNQLERWWPAIEAILDRAEARIREEVANEPHS